MLAKRLNHELIGDEKIHSLAESCDDEYKDACSAYEMEKFQGFFGFRKMYLFGDSAQREAINKGIILT